MRYRSLAKQDWKFPRFVLEHGASVAPDGMHTQMKREWMQSKRLLIAALILLIQHRRIMQEEQSNISARHCIVWGPGNMLF